jgi:hypothetical protein
VWTLGKWKPSWKPGESGDLAHQEGERAGSCHRKVEEDRHHKMPQNIGDGLATTPSHVYAQSMYHCVLCINYHINNHNRNRVLLYYLFQENKSFGSKKPFASSSSVREVVSSTIWVKDPCDKIGKNHPKHGKVRHPKNGEKKS